jgi:isopropylmalate/homocitrate/citramalate synthase
MSSTRRKIQLMDTTLRDGEQTQGVSYSPEEKVNLARALLQQLRVDRIEVASARVSQGEKDAVCSINQWAREHGLGDRIEVLGFVDHSKSVDWILETGGQVVNLLTKGSEKHCREQLGKTLDQHVSEIRRTVDYAIEKGLQVNAYLEDWSNPGGGVRQFQRHVRALPGPVVRLSPPQRLRPGDGQCNGGGACRRERGALYRELPGGKSGQCVAGGDRRGAA